MTAPRIILSTGPVAADFDAIVIDHRKKQISRWGLLAFSPGSYHRSPSFRLAALLILAGAARRPVFSAEIVDHLYGDDADGGPINTHNSISVLLFRVADSLVDLGIHFHGRSGRSGRSCTFMPGPDEARRIA